MAEPKKLALLLLRLPRPHPLLRRNLRYLVNWRHRHNSKYCSSKRRVSQLRNGKTLTQKLLLGLRQQPPSKRLPPLSRKEWVVIFMKRLFLA